MNEYSEECLLTFLENQSQLFDEPVAESMEEAEAFLEDCMAVVVDQLDEVKEYFEENGADVETMSMDELEEASEVFPLPNGQYLIVEGQYSRTIQTKFRNILYEKNEQKEPQKSCSLMDCGFFNGFINCIQEDL